MRKWITILATLGFLPVLGGSTGPVKIGVASSGPGPEADISAEASRAPYILLFDENGGLVEVVDNGGVGAQRAGPQIALALKGKGVTHYIAQRFGPNLVRALDGAGIEHVAKSGVAQEAVAQLIRELNER